jgi:hypothetical protein
VEELLLREGEWFSNEPLTGAEERALRPFLRGPFEIKACYHNALKLALRGRGLEYVEGAAYSIIPVVTHAWVTFNGRPIDVTWRPDGSNARSPDAILRRVRANIQDHVYVGIRVPLPHAAQVLSEGSAALDDWVNRFPLLRNGIPWR